MIEQLRRCFCFHIYKDIKIEALPREKVVSSIGGVVDIDYFYGTICYQKCLKCGKERVVEKSRDRGMK